MKIRNGVKGMEGMRIEERGGERRGGDTPPPPAAEGVVWHRMWVKRKTSLDLAVHTSSDLLMFKTENKYR